MEKLDESATDQELHLLLKGLPSWPRRQLLKTLPESRMLTVSKLLKADPDIKAAREAVRQKNLERKKLSEEERQARVQANLEEGQRLKQLAAEAREKKLKDGGCAPLEKLCPLHEIHPHYWPVFRLLAHQVYFEKFGRSPKTMKADKLRKGKTQTVIVNLYQEADLDWIIAWFRRFKLMVNTRLPAEVAQRKA